MNNWRRRVSLVAVLWAAAAVASPAQTLTSMFSFAGSNGAEPYGALVQGTDGALYGTTYLGGANGQGTAFKISSDGAFTLLYSFCSQSGCPDGINPAASLTMGTNGYLHGATTSDGANGPYGTIFKIGPAGAVTTLFSFDGADGQLPYGTLVQGSDRDLYGTTADGGANLAGTVFKVTAAAKLATVYSFCSKGGCADGSTPLSGLVRGTDGNLYGTTFWDGTHSGGTAFRITPSGLLETLYNFCSENGCADGWGSRATLTQATDGNLYGTTSGGGANGEGTVFKLTTTGTLTTLYTFCSQSNCTDGGEPWAGLIQATDGNFYGTTSRGGANDSGTLFKITSNGFLTSLYSFCAQVGCADGAVPFAGLIQDTDGTFYGATNGGGTGTGCDSGCGTIFRFADGLGPFVKPLPTAGAVGEKVLVQGTKLTGATSVTFNGTPAAFSVVSPSLITTTVPAGATTGTVQVVTPGGTLNSNVAFRVLP